MKDSETYVKRDLTKEELSFFDKWTKKNLRPISKYIDSNKGWVVIKPDSDHNPQEVIIFQFLDTKQYYQLIKDKDDYWGYAGNEESHPIFKAISKAIKHWEFKKDLNPSTVKTFEELIEEL